MKQVAYKDTLFLICRDVMPEPEARVASETLFWSQYLKHLFRGREGFYMPDEELARAIGKVCKTAGRLMRKVANSPESPFEMAYGPRPGQDYGRVRWIFLTAVGKRMNGPVFRAVDRHGDVRQTRLSSQAVSLIVRRRLSAAGIAPTGFSAHSLRAGFVTAAWRAGVPSMRIRAHTGHASDRTLSVYIRNDNDPFSDNPFSELL